MEKLKMMLEERDYEVISMQELSFGEFEIHIEYIGNPPQERKETIIIKAFASGVYDVEIDGCAYTCGNLIALNRFLQQFGK